MDLFSHRRNTCENCGNVYKANSVPPEFCTICGGRMIDPLRPSVSEHRDGLDVLSRDEN